jgi:AraC-like DNA-binding protein
VVHSLAHAPGCAYRCAAQQYFTRRLVNYDVNITAGEKNKMETIVFSPPVNRPHQFMLEAWSGFVSDHFFPLNVQHQAADLQVPQARSAAAGPFQIKGVGASHLQRISADIARDRNPRCAVFLPLKGKHEFMQFGRETRLGPGELLFVDPTEPYDHWRMEDNHCLYFLAPLNYMTERLADARALGARAISCREGVASAAASLMSGMLLDASVLSEKQFEVACRTLSDLLALTLGAWAPASEAFSSVRSANLARIKRYVRKNLVTSGLTALRIARECGISERYLHELFAASDQTVGAFVREERLCLARERLENPRYNFLSITQIAIDCGFSHSSHLSNCFKARFGVSPSDYRQNAETGAAPRSRYAAI